MKPKQSRQGIKLGAIDRKCLNAILEAELAGAPVEAHEWRARNAKFIPRLPELTRNQMLTMQDNTHYVLTLYGLVCLQGERADKALSYCERLFRALRRHYSVRPKEPLVVDELAKRMRVASRTLVQAAEFLSRSPAFLSIQRQESPRLFANENYVTLKSFEELKEKTAEQAKRAATASLPAISAPAHDALTTALETSESEAVRECARTARERLATDPAGAITAARSLLEAGCKHVLEEFGRASDELIELPRLYKTVTGLLKLDSHASVHQALRGMLHGGAMIVDGLAHLRNDRGDAHGRGPRTPKPARRHAEFAVSMAIAMTSFLLATAEAQRIP
jgi:hypothetical protein